MKKIYTLLALISFFAMTSCEKGPSIGDWPPIELDKQQLTFAAEGGEQTVTVENYNHWWINGGYEEAIMVNGRTEYINYVYPTSTEGEGLYIYHLLDGGWYKVVVPGKTNCNTAVITVAPNNTEEPRQATIIMTVGDTSSHIQINQD